MPLSLGNIKEFLSEWESGMRTKDIAAKYGVTTTTVLQWSYVLRKLGIPLSKRHGGAWKPIAAKSLELRKFVEDLQK